VGVIHGHTLVPSVDPEALLIAAREMGVDVFVWGGHIDLRLLSWRDGFLLILGVRRGQLRRGIGQRGMLSEE
jgi:predicted phosphodiesterase